MGDLGTFRVKCCFQIRHNNKKRIIKKNADKINVNNNEMQISLHSAKLAINFTANRKIWQVLLFFKEIVNPLPPIDPNQKRQCRLYGDMMTS